MRPTVERFGDGEALVSRHQDFRATYQEFCDLISRCGKGLLARGVNKGDRVGIWSPSRYEWVVVQYATARIGAILVNINPAYKTAELEYALNQSGTGFLVLARAFRSNDYVGMLDEVKGRCAQLPEALVLEEGWEGLLRDGGATPDSVLNEVEADHQCDPAAG